VSQQKGSGRPRVRSRIGARWWRLVLLVVAATIASVPVVMVVGTRTTDHPIAAFAMPHPDSSRATERPLAAVTDVDRGAQLTGPGSINATDVRWNVTGADLGHTFIAGGVLYMVFGDTTGHGPHGWRSNTMARIDTPDPAAGLRFSGMVTDTTGAAAELLHSLKVDGEEKTVIPTYGIAVGNRMYLHYMSVRRWLTPGRWELNHSGLAYSDDQGRTWTKDPQARWPGTSNFGQVAMTSLDGYVYLFGIPGGRFGGAQLARVPEADLLQLDMYRYWGGRAWTADPGSATIVVPGPVGELSVRWSDALHRWLMMYLDEGRSAIVLRTASRLTGPWGAEEMVTTAARYPQLYAPYMLPLQTGSDLYFTMSQFGEYQVYLMKLRLHPDALVDPGAVNATS